MIIEAFIRWIETARAADRANAAAALARAFLRPDLADEQRQAALLAMSHLLDDPSPQVRLSLAQALAHSSLAPRAIMIALAEDQPEIACTVVALSPVLTDADLIDLAATGGPLLGGFVAFRGGLSRSVAAALAEVGDEGAALILLENETASISSRSVSRIAERFGHCAAIRRLLLERGDLPADARQSLVEQVSTALADSDLVRMVLARPRLERLTLDACETASVAIAGDVSVAELPALVEHLRSKGKLTPALLIHALCSGKSDFFSHAMVALSGLEERRVRSLLASGRMHAVRALFEAAGLQRDIAMVFVEATLLWRQAGEVLTTQSICDRLLDTCRRPADPNSPVALLLDLVEKLQRSELRTTARSYAGSALLAA
ncbi:DUF2336 domain-containing protein [Pseudorhizobium marinum]|uniref:DUF2336 domain-containing protein n=1 Tax=Pseudorhizobium marinum TaxID=1496690 RepID=UPI0004966765|nr:DUF2336 domain-containing protein [Pseudorhizobium marinum]